MAFSLSLRKIYPRAFDKRSPKHDPVLKKGRKPFFMGVGLNFLYLQVLFLALFCYAFGSLFQQNSHIHNLTVVFVDYDGGAIGDAVRNAYSSLEGKGFPSLIERSASDYPTPEDLREAVCKTKYWGAFYVEDGSSNRLQRALGSTAAATAYNNSDVMAYIWNEALYPPSADLGISAPLNTLANTARIEYSTGNGTGALSSVSGRPELSVLANPWKLQDINIQPTVQGSRSIYNTIVIILILIQEFFYLGTLNGLYAAFKIYAKVGPFRIIAVRNMISSAYTFIGSLCVAATIYAFRAGWNINGNQFVLSWMILWLFAHINFLTLDVFTIWLPPQFAPMSLVAWIILNVTSILLPFPLSPAFYRVGYAIPAHQVYQVLVDIWSFGCNPQLHIALPVMFSWWVLGLTLGAVGVYRRCHFATLGEEAEAAKFKERLDAAVNFEVGKMNELKEKRFTQERKTEPEDVPSETAVSQSGDEEDTMRDELSHVLQQVDTRQQQREHKNPTAPCSFGPSFSLPFNYNDNDNSSSEEN
ncbi:hypothetical protein BGZ63DRAFT_349227 [Mariannaea sp. PMI_226]|nr:hypothetical protein BGZ63DRAFT_349227 [Mariannaea sp. PMI_226]